MTRRIILHVDMDSFFASVEMHEHPELKGRPVVVGADPKGGTGRGVVSTCSYEARRYGIRSGMPISTAYRLCPDAAYLIVNFPLYLSVSDRVMQILKNYDPEMMQVSIDEAYLDMSSVESYAAARMVAHRIKEEVLEKEGITCSVGIGPSMLVAKIASDYQKPNGLTCVEPADVGEFLAPLDVGTIPGIGKKTGTFLNEMGIRTIRDLRDADIQMLRSVFGKFGLQMHDLALGRDIFKAGARGHRKSFSREVTFAEDTDDLGRLFATMEALAADLQEKMQQKGCLCRTVTVKIRSAGFVTHTRSRTRQQPTNDLRIIKRQAAELLREFLNSGKIRLIGLRLSNLERRASQQKLISDYLQEGIDSFQRKTI
jgi:DNA polymerase IV (DinB-like DNA polymerase)